MGLGSISPGGARPTQTTLQLRHCPSAVVSLAVFVLLLLNAQAALCGCYKHIFSFGDSIIDAGNFVHNTGSSPSQYKELPYGMTFFNRPTGRIADGRVLIDFYAQALGLPLVPPSMPEETTGQFAGGANFAVLAAIALPPAYYKSKYGYPMNVPSCLDWQLNSFKKMLARIAPGAGATKKLLGESLVVMGEIGGNDYNFWFLGDPRNDRNTPERYMPDVVARIGAAVQEVIDLGARAVLVPGNFPIGCVPAYLSGKRSDNPADYDEHGCLRWYNGFSQRHNAALVQEVGRLRARNPGAKVIYVDYYGAAMQLFGAPRRYGIGDPLVACCGGDERYHTGKTCNRTAHVWGNPAGFANWDGVHFTEKAYSVIAAGVHARRPLRLRDPVEAYLLEC